MRVLEVLRVRVFVRTLVRGKWYGVVQTKGSCIEYQVAQKINENVNCVSPLAIYPFEHSSTRTCTDSRTRTCIHKYMHASLGTRVSVYPGTYRVRTRRDMFVLQYSRALFGRRYGANWRCLGISRRQRGGLVWGYPSTSHPIPLRVEYCNCS